MADRIATYAEFWPFYLREHSKPATRAWHFAGAALSLVALALAIATRHWWWLFGIPLMGYGAAWISHFGIEHNRPATFKYPWWSLVSDWRMFLLAVIGRLRPELDRAGVAKATGGCSCSR